MNSLIINKYTDLMDLDEEDFVLKYGIKQYEFMTNMVYYLKKQTGKDISMHRKSTNAGVHYVTYAAHEAVWLELNKEKDKDSH